MYFEGFRLHSIHTLIYMSMEAKKLWRLTEVLVLYESPSQERQNTKSSWSAVHDIESPEQGHLPWHIEEVLGGPTIRSSVA